MGEIDIYRDGSYIHVPMAKIIVFVTSLAERKKTFQ